MMVSFMTTMRLVTGQPVIKGKITKPERIYNDDPNKNERTNKLLGVYLDKHLII